jgi:hypothetical protein
MSSKGELEVKASTTSSSTPSIHNDDKLHYEETTAFSDPLPRVTYLSSDSDPDENGDLIKSNPFLDPDVALHWTAIYEKAQYESRHEFDPTFTWTKEEEKKLIRKLDLRVCLWAVSCHILFIQLHTNVFDSVSCSSLSKPTVVTWFKLWQTTY